MDTTVGAEAARIVLATALQRMKAGETGRAA
jgi:hypothetical protein